MFGRFKSKKKVAATKRISFKISDVEEVKNFTAIGAEETLAKVRDEVVAQARSGQNRVGRNKPPKRTPFEAFLICGGTTSHLSPSPLPNQNETTTGQLQERPQMTDPSFTFSPLENDAEFQRISMLNEENLRKDGKSFDVKLFMDVLNARAQDAENKFKLEHISKHTRSTGGLFSFVSYHRSRVKKEKPRPIAVSSFKPAKDVELDVDDEFDRGNPPSVQFESHKAVQILPNPAKDLTHEQQIKQINGTPRKWSFGILSSKKFKDQMHQQVVEKEKEKPKPVKHARPIKVSSGKFQRVKTEGSTENQINQDPPQLQMHRLHLKNDSSWGNHQKDSSVPQKHPGHLTAITKNFSDFYGNSLEEVFGPGSQTNDVDRESDDNLDV